MKKPRRIARPGKNTTHSRSIAALAHPESVAAGRQSFADSANSVARDGCLRWLPRKCSPLCERRRLEFDVRVYLTSSRTKSIGVTIEYPELLRLTL